MTDRMYWLVAKTGAITCEKDFSCVLDGGDKYRIMLVSGTTPEGELVIKGLQFVHGSVKYDGGAITIVSSPVNPRTVVVVQQCRFLHNKAAASGGAVYIRDRGTVVTFVGTAFEGNEAMQGGGDLYRDNLATVTVVGGCGGVESGEGEAGQQLKTGETILPAVHSWECEVAVAPEVVTVEVSVDATTVADAPSESNPYKDLIAQIQVLEERYNEVVRGRDACLEKA